MGIVCLHRATRSGSWLSRGTSDYSAMAETRRSASRWNLNCRAMRRLCTVTAIVVIEPMRKRGLITLLKTMKPLEEGFPEIEDSVPAP
jgi:hypothetical protein